MSQSSVSYWLEQLRKQTSDTVFIRSGNGVVPTEQADRLIPIAKDILLKLEAIVTIEDYDPAQDNGLLRIAGTPVERHLVIAPMIKKVLDKAPELQIDVSAIGAPYKDIERLQGGSLDFLVSPYETMEGEGIMRRALFTFEDVVFFDPAHPISPNNLDGFCARPHIRIALGPDAGFPIDERLANVGKTRHAALQVSDFDSVLQLIKGTNLIATLPMQLETSMPSGIMTTATPWPQRPQTMYLFWHVRQQNSKRHIYRRNQLLRLAKKGVTSADRFD
jgi:DNA-binding transcriptional LysR family regulator